MELYISFSEILRFFKRHLWKFAVVVAVCGLLFGLLGFSAHSLFANIIVSVVGACVFLFVARRLTK